MRSWGYRWTVALTFTLLIGGCIREPVSYRKSLVMGMDISNQNKAQLDFVGHVGYEVVRRAPLDESVKVYVFAHTYEIVYGAGPLKSKAKFNSAIGSRLNKPSPEMHIPETRTEVMVAEFASLSISVPTEIILVTDGGIEGLNQDVIQAIKTSIKKLSENRNVVRILILGVQQEHRKRWEGWIAPFGGRGHVFGSNDYAEGLQSIGRFGK
jgi:hypothetical protein